MLPSASPALGPWLEIKRKTNELMEPILDDFEGSDVRGSEGSDCSGLSGWSRNSVNEEESEEEEVEIHTVWNIGGVETAKTDSDGVFVP